MIRIKSLKFLRKKRLEYSFRLLWIMDIVSEVKKNVENEVLQLGLRPPVSLTLNEA